MISIHRGAERHHWSNEWLESWQSFPATGNYDLEANAHGVLMVHNDDVVDPGEGLDRHQHAEMEIVTWVVDGGIEHRDTHGHSGVLRPGHIQRMTAGTGIAHSERNAMPRSSRTATRVIQMWLPPDTPGLEPSYAEADIADQLTDGNLVAAASGRPGTDAAISLANRYVTLHVARLDAGQEVTIPGAPFGHLFVVNGTVELEGVDVPLTSGDAARTTDEPALTVTATEPAEILYWEMHASIDG